VGKSGEFYTFDEVIRRLDIDETKLKRLVSEGEIRAFREGDQMKFRRQDVENLDLTGARSEEETGVIDLSAGKEDTSETLTDDLIFDEGDDLDLTSAEAGMATAEISSQDTFVDEGVGMSTEPLSMDPNEMTEVVEGGTEGIVRRERMVVSERKLTRRTVDVEEPHDTGWAVLLSLSALVMLLAVIVVLGVRDEYGYKGQAAEVARKIAAPFDDRLSKERR
jgi:excisionase family DNA binding protein